MSNNNWHKAREDEVTFRDLLGAFVRRWPMLMIVTAITTFAFAAVWSLRPNFPARGRLIVVTGGSSELSAISQTVSAATRANGLAFQTGALDDMQLYLESNDFLVALMKRLRADAVASYPAARHLDTVYLESKLLVVKSNARAAAAAYPWLDGLEERELADRLRKRLAFSTDRDMVIEVEAATNHPEASVYLANTALTVARDELTRRELEELQAARRLIEQEIARSEKAQAALTAKTIQHRTRTESLGVGANLDGLSAVTTGLRSKISEATAQIAELRELVGRLGGKRANPASTPDGTIDGDTLAKYGRDTEVRALRAQLRQVEARRVSLEASLRAHLAQAPAFVVDQEALIEAGKRLEFETTLAQELTRKLMSLGVQETGLKQRIRILEFARPGLTVASPTLFTVIVLGIMLSILLGGALVLLLELVRPSGRSAESVPMRDSENNSGNGSSASSKEVA